MERAEDDGAEAAFDAELHRMAEAARDAFLAKGTPGDPGGLSLRARADDGFDLGVQRGSQAVEVRIGPWTHREAWDTADDAAESLDAALDLVAAAMWGRIVLREIAVGDKPWRWIVRLSIGDVSRDIASGGGGLLGWRPGKVVRDRVNRASLPAGIAMGQGGVLPSRPWIGVRGEDADLEPAALPLHGELDLHPFSPKDVAPLVREYIAACRQQGVLQLRIVHGKGKGQLRRTVHSLLSRHEAVASYRLGGHGEGSWGATIVVLHPPPK